MLFGVSSECSVNSVLMDALESQAHASRRVECGIDQVGSHQQSPDRARVVDAGESLLETSGTTTSLTRLDPRVECGLC